MTSAPRLSWLLLLVLTACSQPIAFNLPSPTPGVTADRPSIATAPPDKFEPPPDPSPIDPAFAPSSILPSKVGECADTTVTMITDRYGADLTPSRSKKGPDTGALIRFSNSGVQVSMQKDRAIARSQLFDKVNMCLVEIPKDCPAGDIRGRVYKTTNLRTGESWSLPNDVQRCGGA